MNIVLHLYWAGYAHNAQMSSAGLVTQTGLIKEFLWPGDDGTIKEVVPRFSDI